jgi:hypothetical protein
MATIAYVFRLMARSRGPLSVVTSGELMSRSAWLLVEPVSGLGSLHPGAGNIANALRGGRIERPA